MNGTPVPTVVCDWLENGDTRYVAQLWFDLNGNGKREPGELIENGSPFMFHGKWWTVESLGNDGTIRIVRSQRRG